MGNNGGKCQHTPLDQFDDPCPECPPWPEGQAFVFGGPGLVAIPEEVEKEQQQDASSNSTEPES
jgi:hypothetical protein